MATSLANTFGTVLLVEIGNGGGSGVVAVDKLSGPDQNAMERERADAGRLLAELAYMLGGSCLELGPSDAGDVRL